MSVVSFDIETAGKSIFTHTGDDFLRLYAYQSDEPEPVTSTDFTKLVHILNDAEWISAHNFFGFDGLALAYHAGANWEKLAAKAIDTMLLARLDYPPEARDTGGSVDKYDLDHVCERYGVAGKTDDIRALARKYGGFDKIPLDDPDYLRYVAGDVTALRGTFGKLRKAWTPYARREHQVATIFGRMTLNGFLVDQPLLEQRINEGESRKTECLSILSEDYDLPLGKFRWTGKGENKEEHWEAFTSPLTTLDGRRWLIEVYDAFGVRNPPVTKDGRLAIGTEALAPLAESEMVHPDLRRIMRLMSVVTSTRTIYHTLQDHLSPEGRVHALVSMKQASGRSSVTDPGLTVFGKRGERWREREVLLPEPGYVLISADMSQLDMRAVAGLCQDPAYIDLLAPGKDAHAEIAQLFYGDPAQRQACKKINHGATYGLSANKMIAQGYDPELVRTFFAERQKKFPRLIEWQEKVRAQGASGSLLDNSFDRMMRCNPSRAFTQAPALMGQGAAADIMKQALLRMPPEFGPMFRAYVHDEVLLCCREEDAEEVRRETLRAMQFEWRGVEILADVSKPGRSWGEVSGKLCLPGSA